MRTTRWVSTFLIVLGGGLPFFVLVQWGGLSTSAALVGTVTPGSVPVFLTLLGVVVGLRFSSLRWLGVISVAAGVVIAITAGAPSSTSGVMLLLTAGALWSLYTYAVGKTRYRPLHIAVLLSVPSAIAIAVFSVAGVFPVTLFSGTASSSEIFMYAMIQGVVIGVVSTLLYSYSIATLGSTRSALMGAGSPVLATLLAIPFLGEIPSASTIACLALVTVGALTANIWGKTWGKAQTRNRVITQLRVRNVSI
jgi:drug/metabolite transporter (DMT)-like permease